MSYKKKCIHVYIKMKSWNVNKTSAISRRLALKLGKPETKKERKKRLNYCIRYE